MFRMEIPVDLVVVPSDGLLPADSTTARRATFICSASQSNVFLTYIPKNCRISKLNKNDAY